MATQDNKEQLLPLLNRLVDVVVVYGADHHSLKKNTNKDGTEKDFRRLKEWAQTAQGEKTFEFDPYLLATISPLAACFTYEKNPLENYPHIDVSDCFNEKQMCISKDRVHTLQKLVFPDGARITCHEHDPLVISSRLTDIDGRKNYCTSLTFYRKYTLVDDQLQPVTPSRVYTESLKNDTVLYVPVSVALISQTPCYKTQNELLSCLFNQLQGDVFDNFWTTLVDFSQRIFTIPIPPPGSLKIGFNLYEGQHSWVLDPPDPNTPFGESSQLDIRLHYPFLCLTPQNVLKVLTAILTEKNILFISSHYTLLTFVIECMFHYISPLEWRYTTITTLGSYLLDLLGTPGVYLYGIHTSSLKDKRVEEVEATGAVWVDLDEGRVHSNLPKCSQIPILPNLPAVKFLSRYNSLQTNPDIWMTEVPAFLSDEKQIEWRKAFEAEYDRQLTDAFLDLMVDLLGDLFAFKLKGGTNIEQWEGYEKLDADDQYFYKELWKADLWLNLVQQRDNRYLRDQFTIRVEALQKQTSDLQNTQARLRSTMIDIKKRPSIPNWTTGPHRTTGPQRHSLIFDLGLLLQSQLPTRGQKSHGFLSRSASASEVAVSPRMVLYLPEYTPVKSVFFQQFVDTVTEIITELQQGGDMMESSQARILAPLYFLLGCYQVTLKKLLEAIDSFDRTERYIVGLRLTKQQLTFITKAMSQSENEQFREKPCFHEFNKILQDYRVSRQGGSVMRYHRLDKDPLSLDKFKHKLKECNVARDIDTQLKLFNVLSRKLGVVKPEVFREFIDNWNDHKKETEEFQLPNFTLLDTPSCDIKERVLLIEHSSCRSSSGNGPLVLTTYRLLVVTRGSTQVVFDLRKLVKLKIHDMDLNILWSCPAISELVVGEEDVKGQRQGWYVSFPKQIAQIRNFWHSMMQELMLGYQLSIKLKSPELIEQAQTTVLIIYAALKCSLFHNMKDESKINRLICKLQNFAKKDESIKTQQLPGLKCRLNPSLEEADKRTIECSLYVPPQEDGEGQGKLWLGLGSGLLKVYDLETRSPEAYVKVTDCYHRKGARLSCLLLVGDYVWAGSLNKTIHILNAGTCCVESRLSHLEDDVRDLALDEENNVVWSLLLVQNKVIAWDPVRRESIKMIHVPDCQQCKCLAVYKNQLWIGTNNGISVFDKETGDSLTRITEAKSSLDIRCLAGSSTNDIWCSSHGATPLIVYDPNTFEVKRLISNLQYRVNVILSVHDKIWCGTKKGKILVYDAKTFEQKSLMDAHGDTIRTMVTTKEGIVISGCASRDGTAAIWDAMMALKECS